MPDLPGGEKKIIILWAAKQFNKQYVHVISNISLKRKMTKRRLNPVLHCYSACVLPLSLFFFGDFQREKVWREVSPYMRLYGNQDSIVLKAAHIHNAYLWSSQREKLKTQTAVYRFWSGSKANVYRFL